MQYPSTRRDFPKDATVTATTVALPWRANASSDEFTSGESITPSWLAKQFTRGDDGRAPSNPHSRADPSKGWLPAVPGTVLTTLLMNGVVSDPYFGLNNHQISNVSRMTDDTLAC
ncbi:MAG TPA: hypothetical protein VIT23_06685 [Terrimicrobiaceae bacterium]